MKYITCQNRLVMNAQQYRWLMNYLERLKRCALHMKKNIMSDYRYMHRSVLPVVVKQQCLYEAKLNRLNQAERECLISYSEAVWKACFKQQSLPHFKYRNLIKADFTYHGVDMRSFMSDPRLNKRDRMLTASTIYRYYGKWYMYLCVKHSE